MRQTSLARNNFCLLFIWRIATLERRLSQSRGTGKPPTEATSGQLKTHATETVVKMCTEAK